VRDPNLPYRTFIPLTAEPDGAPDAGILDLTDIRQHDLSQVDLVVLSGCSSGATYIGPGAPAPTLADAFLDSGVGAVVKTYWRVRDLEAGRLMTRFVTAWADQQQTPLAALNAARRAEMTGPHGARHPFGWGAYGIELSGFWE